MPLVAARRRAISHFTLLHLLESIALVLSSAALVHAQALDKDALLAAQTFWDNRDWDWYKDQIPFFDSPDAELNTTYYYRWELMTKHLVYGSLESGYAFTEFMDRPFWSGAFGAISCPAGHQLYEARWLRHPQIARDYARYWFETPGAQPRNYSCWLADAVWAVHQCHPNAALLQRLLPALVKNYEGWEARHWVEREGLFWQTGHDDGMEYNINSRQTPDLVRGAPGFRPTLNAYLWADARAIERVARLAGDPATADRFAAKARTIKANLQAKLWDPKREFFFHKYQHDESYEGQSIRAGSLTYQSGRFAGDSHGRELIGFVPWQFNMLDPGYEAAWKSLMDRERFFADFGPTTVERHDPLFYLAPHCCYWSGQSWPYGTSQTLKALANLLHRDSRPPVSRADYYRLLRTFALTHRKAGRPYLAEACRPDTGSWESHDSYNHSEHYFHSSFIDLVITGLAGLITRDDDLLEVQPLAPDDWDYFAIDDLVYRGRRVSVLWDRTGERYRRGRGLMLLVDGAVLASTERLERLTAQLPAPRPQPSAGETATMNFAVNNRGAYYPRVSASFAGDGSSAATAIDGNYWYHRSPPNRWSCAQSPHAADWIAVDFGVPRQIDTIKVYPLDDQPTDETLDNDRPAPAAPLRAPAALRCELWRAGRWTPLEGATVSPPAPAGRRANIVRFPLVAAGGVRVVLEHAGESRSGLTELEAWGPAVSPLPPAPGPVGNLALRQAGREFPKATASFTSRFDDVAAVNDGVSIFRPTPNNRWTSYESPRDEDWLELDFGEPRQVGRLELHIYDDRGGVQAPSDYRVEHLDDGAWREVADLERTPDEPTGGIVNSVKFRPVSCAKLRVVFRHRGAARSGLTEIEAWAE